MQHVVNQTDRARVAPLFSSIPYWRAFIESATERDIGTLSVDNPRSPEVAVLFYGGLVVYGGRVDSSESELAIRLHETQPIALVHGDWERLFRRIRAGQFRENTRYCLPSESLSTATLRDAMTGHDGHIQPVTRDTLPELETALGWEHQRHHFDSVEHFLEDGHGFVGLSDDRVVSGASSFAISRRYSECQVTTATEHRRRGYGRAVAAHYVNSCRKRDLSAPWDASNAASVKLARSIGYEDVEEYLVFEQM